MITLDLMRVLCFVLGGAVGLVVGFVVASVAMGAALQKAGWKTVKS